MPATPSIVQTVVDAPPTPLPTIGGTRVVAWGSPTLAGSRLLCFVSENDNQIDTITVSVSGGGAWTEVTPPGDVIRVATGHNEIALRCFERLNAGAGAASVSVAIGSASVYPAIILVEVKDSHLTIPTDAQNSGTGSLQTASISCGPTSRGDILYLVCFASGNKDTHSIPPGDTSGFAIVAQGGSGGAGNSAKINTSLLAKSITVGPDTSTASVLIAGGFNHNYAGMVLAIPGVGAGGGGGGPDPFGLPDTDDGSIHRACSIHYYGGGIVADASGTAIQNAQTLAGRIDMGVANVIQAITAAGGITTDKYNGLADNMIAVNPDLMLMPYDKSAQIDEGASFYPNDYYAHACPWPTGAKLTTFSAAIYVAQPSTGAGQSAFVDPRGWTAHSFKEQRSRDAWSRVAKYNTIYGADTLKGVYHDSMGTSTWKGSQCNPDTNTLYSEDPWIGKVWEVGDESRARRPFANYMVFGNGLVTGASYFGARNLGNLLLHVDGGLAENWLRNNMTAATAFHTEAAWQQDVDMVIDANIVKGKWFWGIINICNQTAGGGACPAFSAAQLEQWRRYSMATYLLSNRGKSVFEFVEDTSSVKPWAEAHPYYQVALGPPLDTAASAVATKHTEGAQPAGNTLYSYRRRHTSGCAWVNPTTAPVVITMDRDYKTPPGVTPTATYLTGSSQSLPAHSGLVLQTVSTGGANAGPPVPFWSYPPLTTKVASTKVQVFFSDPDGVASAEYNLNGAGWLPLTFQVGNGDWEASIVLAPGVNVIQARATDANPSPLTSAPITHNTTLVANDGPPVVTFNNPPATVADFVQLVQLTVTDADGITSVEVSVNNQTSWAPCSFNAVSGKWERSVTLLEGNNTIYARATDAYPIPGIPGGLPDRNVRSTPVSTPVLVTSVMPPPPPPTPTPDPNKIPSIGAGEYQVALLSRGGGTILQTITAWTQIDWERVEGATGAAKITINGKDAVAECCGALAAAEPWLHEIGVYRKDPQSGRFKRIWCGPIVDIDVSLQNIVIDAYDLSKWLERRRVHKDHVTSSLDLATLLKDLADDGIAPDPSMRLSTTQTPSGQTGQLNILAAEHLNAMDEIKQLAGLGCSWTVIQRTLRIGGDLTRPAPVTTLIDDHFVLPIVRRDGAATVNSPGVRGAGVGSGAPAVYGSTTDPASITKYGLLESDVTDDAAATDLEANAAAVQAAALYSTPPIILTGSNGGRLSPLAPITLPMLVPGNVVAIALAQLCIPITGNYRIQSVKGSATTTAETIDVVFQPLGASSA